MDRFGNTCAAKGHDISGGSVTKCEAVILGRIAACFCRPAKSTFNWKTALDVLLAGGTMGSSFEAQILIERGQSLKWGMMFP